MRSSWTVVTNEMKFGTQACIILLNSNSLRSFNFSAQTVPDRNFFFDLPENDRVFIFFLPPFFKLKETNLNINVSFFTLSLIYEFTEMKVDSVLYYPCRIT